jgi:hypothetical protein
MSKRRKYEIVLRNIEIVLRNIEMQLTKEENQKKNTVVTIALKNINVV